VEQKGGAEETVCVLRSGPHDGKKANAKTTEEQAAGKKKARAATTNDGDDGKVLLTKI